MNYRLMRLLYPFGQTNRRLPSIESFNRLFLKMKSILLLLVQILAMPQQASEQPEPPMSNSEGEEDFGTIEMLSYECRFPHLNDAGDVVPPSEEDITGKGRTLVAKNNEIIKASDFDWENTKSIFWDYPRPQFQLEFYTGDKKYASVRAPTKGWMFEIICGFKRVLNEEESDAKIEIDDKVFKELNGRIFQTKDSYVKIVEWK